MSKVYDFLKEAGVFFLATTDGDQPKIRPLTGLMEMDGKVLFSVGDFKNVYKQMQANPLVEISACKPDGKWLRYTGKVVFETDPKYAAIILEGAPQLKETVYNETTGYKVAVFHLEDATASIIAGMEPIETIL